MQSDTAAVHVKRARPAVPPGMSYRSRGLDGRSRIMKRAAQLAAHYTALLDTSGRETASVPLATAIISTAELVAIAEDMRTRMLRGENVSADAIVRVQRLADMSIRRLGLPSLQPQPTSPTLADIIGEGAE